MLTCPSCPGPSVDGKNCPACVAYWRSVMRAARRPPCRCDANDCNECADRGQAFADMREDRR